MILLYVDPCPFLSVHFRQECWRVVARDRYLNGSRKMIAWMKYFPGVLESKVPDSKRFIEQKRFMYRVNVVIYSDSQSISMSFERIIKFDI